MNRVFFFIILISAFSCNTKTPVFEIFQEVNFTIPAGLDPIATHGSLIHDIPSFLNEHLTEKQIKLSAIDQLYAGRGRILSIYSNANFGVISKISVWIYKKGDYENRIEIYYRDEVPLNLNGEIKLLSTGEDVREILKEDFYEMDIRIQFKYFVQQQIDCRFIYSYAAYQE